MTEPPFLSVAQRDRPGGLGAGSATEICGRDFLRLVLLVGNSNEIRAVAPFEIHRSSNRFRPVGKHGHVRETDKSQ
jgi:hypothetical protein